MSNNYVQQAFGDFATAVADFTDRFFLREIFERSQLVLHDRSLITITNLVSQYRND